MIKPLYPAISIVVLSTGIACLLLTSVWIRDELSYDSSYNNSDKLYRLTIEKNDKITGYHTHIARSWYEWMKNIKNDVTGIKDFGRFISRGETTIKIDSSVFNSRLLVDFHPCRYNCIYNRHFNSKLAKLAGGNKESG
jgi:hypothetical protein